MLHYFSIFPTVAAGPYFHQLLIQGIREFWCDRRGTLSKTSVWSTAQSIWEWLWRQRCGMRQIG